ncbi:MAG UNVERIFIED_CONTAM: hypothetical protein LVR18_15625 [Planctomycetaceae bacterium]
MDVRSAGPRVLKNLQPDNPDVLHQLSACRAKLGRYDEAVAAAAALRRSAGLRQLADRL